MLEYQLSLKNDGEAVALEVSPSAFSPLVVGKFVEITCFCSQWKLKNNPTNTKEFLRSWTV